MGPEGAPRGRPRPHHRVVPLDRPRPLPAADAELLRSGGRLPSDGFRSAGSAEFRRASSRRSRPRVHRRTAARTRPNPPPPSLVCRGWLDSAGRRQVPSVACRSRHPPQGCACRAVASLPRHRPLPSSSPRTRQATSAVAVLESFPRGPAAGGRMAASGDFAGVSPPREGIGRPGTILSDRLPNGAATPSRSARSETDRGVASSCGGGGRVWGWRCRSRPVGGNA